MICRKSRIAAPDGLVTTPIRRGSTGIGAFAPGIEQPFGGQFILNRFKPQLKVADSGEPELTGAELVFAAHLVDGQVAECLDQRAVGDAELGAGCGSAEKDAAHLASGILDGEIDMARAVNHKGTDFAAKPEGQQTAFDDFADGAVDVGDAPDLFRIFHKNQINNHVKAATVPPERGNRFQL